MSASSFESLKTAYLSRIEAHLDRWLTCTEKEQEYAALFEASRYSTMGSGKRLRPLLVFAVGDLYQADTEALLDFAAAVELIHTYSFIHDDLPCMDNDSYRRGKKTLHKTVGEGVALLTGNFLLTLAFEKIARSDSLANSLKTELIGLSASCAGHAGMIGGQYLDITSYQHPHTPELFTSMHMRKTGSLMRLATEGAALIASAQPLERQAWATLGLRLGLLFQIVDDLLDALPSSGLQVPLGPSSFISIEGVEKTWLEARRLKSELLASAQLLDPQRSVLNDIIEMITHQYEMLPQILSPVNES